MIIGKEVDVPAALIAALRDRRLVIFAGAGISMGAPSNLPDFARLADDVGGKTAKRQDGEPLDSYLGRVESLGANVQELTRKRLSDPLSLPRVLHGDLVGLFSDAAAVRIITTNFDTHLTTECVKRFGDSVELYCGPALPTGRDFAGLACIHGSLAKKTSLVLTDRDFGRAYMVDGWATRLLLDVFQHFTVLFVGYSHDDPVMKYLARSLVGESHRFVMTLPGQDTKWQTLGIEPIHFPPRHVGDKYAALDDFFAAWVKRTRMGALEHQVRVRDIVTKSIPLEKEDQDYIRGALDDPVLLQFFVDNADSVEWLRWAESTGALDALFLRDRVGTAAQESLARWFAQKYSLSHAAVALHLVSEKGGVLSPTLWYQIAWHLGIGEQVPTVGALNKWILVLIASARDHYSEHLLSQLLARCTTDEHIIAAKALFRHLVRPAIQIQKAWIAPEESQGTPRVRLSIRTRGEAHQLETAWKDFFIPRLTGLIGFLRSTLIDALIEAHTLVAAETDGAFDTLSFARSAIEPHGQDKYPDDFDFIIDCLRTVLEAQLSIDQSVAMQWVSDWIDSDVPLLRRLALHGLAESMCSGDDALGLIAMKDLLYAPHLKHEVYRAIEKKFSTASPAGQTAFVSYANKGIVLEGENADDEARTTSDYERFNVAAWLVHVAPTSVLAKENFEAREKQHPEFGVRDVMDFDHWSTDVHSVVETSPLSPDQLLAEDPSAHLDTLLTFKGRPHDFEGPSRAGLMQAVREAAGRNAVWSIDLARALAAREEWTNSVWSPLLGAWKDTDPASLPVDELLAALREWPKLSSSFGRDIADLVEGIASKSESFPAEQLSSMERLIADSLILDDSPDGIVLGGGRTEWLTVAINQAGGRTALALIRLLSARVKREGHLAGLPDLYRITFERFVADGSLTAARARIVLASQLHFFFAIDAQWTRSNLLPLFDWSLDEIRAEQSWDGYAHWGRWNDALLAELLPLLPDTFRRLEGSLGDVTDTLVQRLVGVSLYLATDPWHQNGWLVDFVREGGEEARRLWASHFEGELRRMKPEAIRTAWDGWVRDYWADRLSGVPRPLTDAERGEMIEWTLSLKPMYGEAVDFVCAAAAPLPEHTFFFHRLRSEEAVDSAPRDTVRLVTHVLKSSKLLLYECGYVEEVLRRLNGNGIAKADLHDAVESMIHVGCTNGGALWNSLA